MSSQRVREVLDGGPQARKVATPGVIGQDCEGSKFHNPRPLTVSSVNLATQLGQAETLHEADIVYLCGTCRDNLTIYLAVRQAWNGQTPQAVRRDFGNVIRELGDRAWDHYAAGMSGRGSSA